jgi:hypothetical protein
MGSKRLAMLRQRGVTVPVYHYNDHGFGKLLHHVPGDWYVYDADPWAPRQVMLFVGCRPIWVPSKPVKTRSTTPHRQMAVPCACSVSAPTKVWLACLRAVRRARGARPALGADVRRAFQRVARPASRASWRPTNPRELAGRRGIRPWRNRGTRCR